MTRVFCRNPTCQHRHVDNGTLRCTACDERMIGQLIEVRTVRSAPNLAAGVGDCPVYIPDVAQECDVVLGWDVTYTCERCWGPKEIELGNDGIRWPCGHKHYGDFIPA